MSVDAREQRGLYEARRHLGTLGIQTQFTARGDALKGEMTFRGEQVLRNPDGGTGIERIRFTVLADGSFRIDDPPQLDELTGLPPARQLASVEAMSKAIRQAMDRRFAALRKQGSKLREFGFRLQTDPERMVLVARVDLERLGVVLVESEGTGFVARELLCEGGRSFPFPDTPLDLSRFNERIDLELFLAGEAERLVPDQAKKTIVSGHYAVREETTELFGELTAGVSEIVSGLTPPSVGQVWVMDVIVETDDGNEVRYRGVGFTGQAFGAPRVLPKPV